MRDKREDARGNDAAGQEVRGKERSRQRSREGEERFYREREWKGQGRERRI